MMSILLVMGVVGLVSSAGAAACGVNDAPSLFTSSACNAGTSPDVCIRTGSSIECDPARSGSTSPTFYAVSGYNGSGSEYVFYGVTPANTKFCCAFDDGPTEITVIDILGTDLDDTIALQDSTGTWFLEDPSGTATLYVDVDALGGDDVIDGALANQATLDETLRGNVDDDTLTGFGECRLEGGGESDTLIGSGSADVLIGDSEFGGGFGTEGTDYVSAGPGNDSIITRGAVDLVCSDQGADDIDGGGSNDVLWGGLYLDGADNIDGGGGLNNSCGPSLMSMTDCQTTISSAPSECP